jgi:hypothetical protein
MNLIINPMAQILPSEGDNYVTDSLYSNYLLYKETAISGSWERSGLHNEELHNMYSSPSIIRMIKLRRMQWPQYKGLVPCH